MSTDKDARLEMLREEILRDSSLPLGESNLVFGEGNSESTVMFIGEAPGFHEDRQGRPFVGRAGELLTTLITGIGWRREDVYITNIVKRRPPDNRDPAPEEIEAYKPYLTRQVDIINPAVIIPLGRFAMNYFLPDAKISRDQGRVFTVGGRRIYPLFHPAAALRSSAVLELLKKTFSLLPSVVENKTPSVEDVTIKKSPHRGDLQGSLFA